MKKARVYRTESCIPSQDETLKEKLNQSMADATSLKDLPLEVRKKEASKPLYLARYE